MKKLPLRILLTVLIIAAVVLLRGYSRRAITRGASKPPPATVPAPPRPADDAESRSTDIPVLRVESAPPAKPADDTLLDEARAALTKDDMRTVQDVAARLRREARRNPEFLKRLETLLGDGRESSTLRGVVAIVLGSLPDGEVQKLLAQTLATVDDPGLQGDLIVALGSAKDFGEYDDIFLLSHERRDVQTLYLNVRVETVIADSAIRSTMGGLLTGSSNSKVRWLAVAALRYSIQFPDVRQTFLTALRARPNTEPGEASATDAQGEIAASLVEWAAGEDLNSPERWEIFITVFQEGQAAPAGVFLLSTNEALLRMEMTKSEVRLLAGLLDSRDFDQRRWVISILGNRAMWQGLPMREDLFAPFQKMVATDPDPKIREYAAGALVSFPDKDRAIDLLLGAMADDARDVRVAAARALGRMKRGDQRILDHLKRVSETDGDENVRLAAGEALQLLTR